MIGDGATDLEVNIPLSDICCVLYVELPDKIRHDYIYSFKSVHVDSIVANV